MHRPEDDPDSTRSPRTGDDPIGRHHREARRLRRARIPTSPDDSIDYSIRRSSRAKRVRVTVDRDGVTVVLPERTPDRRAAEAVMRLDGWIRARLAEQDVSRAAIHARGWSLPWLGESLAIVPEADRLTARRDGGQLLVPEGDFRPALERLLRRAARHEFAGRLDRVTSLTGHEWTGLRIGDMKTRWASCRGDGAFSFSWRLMLAPDRVLETVVWHEVCHLDVPNHSARFWALMDERRPGHREDTDWLSRHGAELAIQPTPLTSNPWA